MANALGRAIRARRKQLGLTQDQVADKSGVERSHLTRIEGGRWTPRIDTLERIAGVLKTTAAELMSTRDVKHRPAA